MGTPSGVLSMKLAVGALQVTAVPAPFGTRRRGWISTPAMSPEPSAVALAITRHSCPPMPSMSPALSVAPEVVVRFTVLASPRGRLLIVNRLAENRDV